VLNGVAEAAASAEMEKIMSAIPTHPVADCGGSEAHDRFPAAPPPQEDIEIRSQPLAQRYSPAWGMDARSAVAKATQVDSADAGSWWLPVNFDTCDTSSATASSVDRGVADFLDSPALRTRDLLTATALQTKGGCLDVDSVHTDSSMFYDDVILDSARDVNKPNAPVDVAESNQETHGIAGDLTHPGEADPRPESPSTDLPKPAEHPSDVLYHAQSDVSGQLVPATVPTLPSDRPCAELARGLENLEGDPELGRISGDVEQHGNHQEDIPRGEVLLEDFTVHEVLGGRALSPLADSIARQSDDPGEGGISVSSSLRTPTGQSPLPGADRLAGLLSEAEALLRETAITAAMAAAAANKPDPFLDSLLAVASGLPITFEGDPRHLPDVAAPDAVSPSMGSLANTDALLDAIDGFLGATALEEGASRRDSPRASSVVNDLASDTAVPLRASLQGASVFIDAPPANTATILPRSSGRSTGDILPASAVSEMAAGGAAASRWVSDARWWDGGDLGAQLEEICRELDDVVGLSTARGRELEATRSGVAAH